MMHQLTRAASLLALALPVAASAQKFPTKDTYEATTTNMSPAGLTLRIDVLDWSDESAREAVIQLLGDDSADLPKALEELPTVGAVWREGSAVGHSLKYAHRTPTDDGGQLITFVTNKPLDAYAFEKWKVDGEAHERDLKYSVIELRVPENGSGTGTLSLAADVRFDDESKTVMLDSNDATPVLLTGVKLLPKPYWARDGGED